MTAKRQPGAPVTIEALLRMDPAERARVAATLPPRELLGLLAELDSLADTLRARQ